MRSTKAAMVLMLAALAAPAGAGEYDFYARTRYPVGGRLLPGVSLYRPRQEGPGDPRAYARRVVQWWPVRGVDIIEPNDAMPLRQWTFRTHRPGRPDRFQAHLIAFRGIGNTMSSPFHGDGGPLEPAAVLRLGDGRKRCFPRGSFCEADKQFLMDLYVRAMRRIRAGLDRTPRAKRPSADVRFPDNAKPGEPGTMQVESEHFIWLSGSQAGSDSDPWVNEKAPEKARRFRQGSIECAEAWWALNEYAGHLMPWWDRTEKYKYEITVPGTKRDGHEVIPGYAGGGYGGCGIKGAGGGPWAMALFHEWGHGALSNRWRIGGGEAQADAHQTLAGPVLKGNHHVKAPWRNLFNGSSGYGYTVFYNVVADNPNWGYGWYTCLPSGAGEHTIMQVVARVGQQRGLFADGIRGFGDLVGEYGARLATFDCELEEMFRTAYFAPARSRLEPVEPAAGLYRIPFEQAPEPYGVNIVRLVPQPGAGEIVADFAGLHDEDFFSDWRACLVALGADGRARYSPLWSKGRMSLPRREGDVSWWLTVAATPTAMFDDADGRFVGAVYSGRHAFRYPWSVRLAGARPGTPRPCRADLDDYALRYRLDDAVPVPHDTPAGGAFLAKLKAFEARLAGDETAGSLRGAVRAEIERATAGRRHPNGGGWVARTATVAPTAYVGPDAMVLDRAKVLGSAIIEDYAVVADEAVVEGHARIGGQAVVRGATRVGGYTRLWDRPDGEVTVVPRRLGARAPDRFGLWANYAMDRPEKTLLADWYRFPHGADRRYGRSLGIDLGGYLVGRPEFVADGSRRGFRFNGRDQYAEFDPRVADLGEMTVVVTYRPERPGRQTLLDLGCSAENCLLLRADGGRVELVATVAGRRVAQLAAAGPEPGSWGRVRVACDGRALSLWADGRRADSKPTTFRPCDVFPPGAVKRNFLATRRDGTERFAGVVDSVVFYHVVHEDFTKVPPPTRDAPVRPTEEFLAALRKAYGDLQALRAKVDAGVRQRNAFYEKLRRQMETRRRRLLERSGKFLRAEADLQAAKKAADARKAALAAEFARTPEAVDMQRKLDALNKEVSQLSAAVRELEARRFEADAELASLTARRRQADQARPPRPAERKALDEAIRNRRRALQAELRKTSPLVRRREALAEQARQLGRNLAGRRDVYVAAGMTDMTRRVGQAEAALAAAREEALAPYEPEKLWMDSFHYQAYRGYYNTPYRAYLGQYVRARLGGGEMRENLDLLEGLAAALADGKNWHTRVDWQWRMPEELDGRLAELPLMRKWLARVRGERTLAAPAGPEERR